MDTKIWAIDACKSTSNDVGSLPDNGFVSTIHNTHLYTAEATLGRHLVRRLVEIGVNDVFSIPGDFNLALLNHLLAELGLNLIGCCNKFNVGYARSHGIGARVVTFIIDGLSVLKRDRRRLQ